MMNRRFSSEELRRLRNEIPVTRVIDELLEIPSKVVEGIYRFLCPQCSEFQTSVNPKTNLSRCFRCKRNYNAIELVMEDRKVPFVESVKILQNWGIVRAGPSEECFVQGKCEALIKSILPKFSAPTLKVHQ